MKKALLVSVLFLLASLLFGCAQSLYQKGRQFSESGRYGQAIESFQQELLKHPNSADAWRELGVAYYYNSQPERALAAFNRAQAIEPDARTLLFRGLTFEKLTMWKQAAGSYESALALQPGVTLSGHIRARLERIKRLEYIQWVLENEASISKDTIPDNTVAVYDFDGAGLEPDLSPLADGLAEFTALSLSKVKSLQVIERMKLHELLQELKLVEQGVVDPRYAPRVGLLLGSHHVVTGWVDSPALKMLRMGGAIINTVDSSEAVPDIEEGQLRHLLKLQVDFVFRILSELGVAPTDDERRAIETLPTESYDAFLAYCRGLQHKRQGQYETAQEEFKEAVSLDESFGQAQEQLDDVVSLADDRNFEDYVFEETIPPPPPDVGSALSDIVTTTGGVPGPDESGSGTGDNQTPTTVPPVIPQGSINVTGTIHK